MKFKRAMELFNSEGRDFRPQVLMNNDCFFIMDWKDAGGSNLYRVRYVLDKKEGLLFISGDLGICVADFQNTIETEKLPSLIADPGYFISKIKTSEYSFIYTEEECLSDIEYVLSSYCENVAKEYSDEQFKKSLLDEAENDKSWMESTVRHIPDMGDFSDFALGKTDSEELLSIRNDFVCMLGRYDSKSIFQDFSRFGRTIHANVYLWLYGLREALRMIGV